MSNSETLVFFLHNLSDFLKVNSLKQESISYQKNVGYKKQNQRVVLLMKSLSVSEKEENQKTMNYQG